jgi:Ca2+-binding EF-hand superfamily protein
MKLVMKLVLLMSAYLIINSMNLKTEKSTKVEMTTKEDFTNQWKILFTTVERPPQMCSGPDKLNNTDDDKKKNGDDDGSSNVPKAKANPYAKQQGFGASAYLFDFFDDVMQQQIDAEFQKVFQAAKAMKEPDPATFQDPYTLDKLVFYYSQQGKDTTNAKETDLMSQIQKYNKNFNAQVWGNSINMGQLYSILDQWGWKKPESKNFAKKLLDKFDFDGDGRLNPSEFIILSIVNNISIFKTLQCKANCYTDILNSIIDPLFAYLDCDQDGYVSSENMWIGLVNFKRKDPKLFSMYTCQMPTELNKGYRTTSCNDFILKNYKKADGFVDKDEFRAGILLGYWDRQTDTSKIYTDDTKNLKKLRWGVDGAKDIVCENVLAMIPKPSPKFKPMAITK